MNTSANAKSQWRRKQSPLFDVLIKINHFLGLFRSIALLVNSRHRLLSSNSIARNAAITFKFKQCYCITRSYAFDERKQAHFHFIWFSLFLIRCAQPCTCPLPSMQRVDCDAGRMFGITLLRYILCSQIYDSISISLKLTEFVSLFLA